MGALVVQGSSPVLFAISFEEVRPFGTLAHLLRHREGVGPA